MRMTRDLEAYIDEYDKVRVYFRKGFYGGKSRIFHLKDSQERILPLTIESFDDTRKDYNQYVLKIEGSLEIGEEYFLFDEHCQSVPAIYSHIVKTREFQEEFDCSDQTLGIEYSFQSTTFTAWSPVAKEINLVLVHNGKKEIYPLKKQEKGLWSLTIFQNLLFAHYTYQIRVNGQWKETIDPYNPFTGLNNQYSVVDDFSLLDLPKKVSLPYQQAQTDAIIYEVSVRDMTSWAGCGVKYPKTFKGFIEENEVTRQTLTGFSYLKTLGVTHVQFMPVFKFGSVDESYPSIFYNWGYDPMNYRGIEGSYSTNPKQHRTKIVEFVQMIQALHQEGMKVNLDLVFNHVYCKEKFALENFVPNYFFLMNERGDFSNGSFCGNDIDTRPIMSKKFFLDTVKMIVDRYDVDGFRFDLMGILDIDLMNEIVHITRQRKPDFMIYGEGWNMPSFVPEELRATAINQAQMPEIGFFSDAFRNTARGSNDEGTKGYSNGNLFEVYNAADSMKANVLNDKFSSPIQVLNYVECHDNQTLWDKNRSSCANESAAERQRRQILANAMVLLAQGVPFLHAGQEFGRTKQNLDNTYNRSDFYNQMDYSRRDHHQVIVEATKKLIEIRKKYSSLRYKTKQEVQDNVSTEIVDNQMLVYRTKGKDESLICFFNPTNHFFEYILEYEGNVLFDSGTCNGEKTSKVIIEPISVVVVAL